MSEQNRYVIHAVAATTHDKIDINAVGPLTLISDADANENLLGTLPTESAKEPNWVCILPLQQPQAQGTGDVCAGMNTPLMERWCTIDELTHDLLAPNMRFALQHLDEAGAAVGYNYSPDPRMRVVGGVEKFKFKPNSWDHFHMHWMKGVEESAREVSPGDTVPIRAGRGTMDVRPHRFLREMMPHVIEGILDQEYSNPDSNELSQHIAKTKSKGTVPYGPEGGITFMLPAIQFNDPNRLGSAMKVVHTIYTHAHENVWQIFVSNYDAVKTSGWNEDYTLRPADEATKHLAAFTNDAELRQGIERFFKGLRPERQVVNPMNWLYKGPSYSVALYKHDEQYILSLLPHLMHPTNWLAAMGIFEARQGQDADLDDYRIRAQAHAKRLGALPNIS